MGVVSVSRYGRAASGQTNHREARWPAFAAEAPSSLRALDRGARCGARDSQRPGQDRARERINLHPDRRDPSDGKPRQDRAGTDRGPDRQLSRRGRHHSYRGRLPKVLGPASKNIWDKIVHRLCKPDGLVFSAMKRSSARLMEPHAKSSSSFNKFDTSRPLALSAIYAPCPTGRRVRPHQLPVSLPLERMSGDLTPGSSWARTRRPFIARGREKRGEAAALDLSGVLIVQLGNSDRRPQSSLV